MKNNQKNLLNIHLVPNYSLESFLIEHERLKKEFQNNFLFQLMQSGKLSSDKHKDVFFEYYQEFSNQFQRMIHLRSALCENSQFAPIFTQHFDEEYGHDKMLQKERNDLFLKKDPIVQALCAWFPHKMLVTTPAEQLVISNLCIESAAVIIHTYAIPAFDPEKKSEYYRVHEEHDCYHENMGLSLLENLSPRDYERLTSVLEDAWSICDALMARIGELTLKASI